MKKSNQTKSQQEQDFYNAYVECLLWTHSEELEGLAHKDGVPRIHAESDNLIIKECQKFIQKSYMVLKSASCDFSQHGHDFFLTRNGHGAGFWDRGYGANGDILTKLSESFRETVQELDGDGVLYYTSPQMELSKKGGDISHSLKD